MGAGLNRLAELLDPRRVEQLQREIAAATGAQAVLLDARGMPLDPPAHWGDELTGEQNKLIEEACRAREPRSRVALGGLLCDLAVPVESGATLSCVWWLAGIPCERLPDAPPLDEGEEGARFSHRSLGALAGLVRAFTLPLLEAERERDERERAAATVERLAFTDPLCDLPNDRRLEQDLLESRNHRYLLVVDVAGMGRINDVHGREFGDELLLSLSAYLRSLCPPEARLYRLETADFAILFLEGYNNTVARKIGNSLRRHCEKPWDLRRQGRQKEVSISVNVGAVDVGGLAVSGYHNVVSAIEYTLGLARRRGGVALPDGTGDRGFQARLRLELDLRGAVREKMRGFSLVWQPLVDPGLAIWRGVEALCRWESESIGPVAPAEFIPIAESTGLIGAVGDWVLDQALGQVRAWGLDRQEGFLLGVNLSPVQLAEPDLVRRVSELLDRHAFPPAKLCLEVTGSDGTGITAHSAETLQRLCDIGVGVALDDFGGSYAALETLRDLPVGMIKTNFSMVHGLDGGDYPQRLFGGVVELAHSAGMRVVAKGIETDQQAELVLGQGADLFQGFRFREPMSTDELGERLDCFRSPQPGLAEIGYNRLDLSQLDGEGGGYNLTPSLGRLLNQCMRDLFSNPDGGAAIDDALARIGEALRVSRAYVFLMEEDGTFSNTHEWCAPGIQPEKEALQHTPILELSPGWIGALARDGLLVASDIHTLEQGARVALSAQDIKAVAEFPIWRDGELYGFVGFDDCARNRVWIREEVQMLHTLTGIITATLGKLALEEKVRGGGKRLENMLNAMDTVIYVTDLESRRILFANDALQKLHKQPLTGRVCWEALHGREKACETCPIPFLLENPGKSYQWERYDERLKTHFRSRDSIIPWEQGKMAHFQYAENITALKRYHQQLETVASTDMLTGTLNRSSFELTAQQKAEQGDSQLLTLAFVDIDDLKKANDLYGHAAGDHLILDMVRALRANIRSSDIIGRYGGDEFVVLFTDCDPAVAATRMESAMDALEEMERGVEVGAGFSYGLSTSREVEGGGPAEVVEQMLRLADQRMMEQKRGRKAVGGR